MNSLARMRAMTLATALLLLPGCGVAVAGSTLDAVKARGTVKCGVISSPGFAAPDNAGQWRGFYAEFCRSIAVALFGDPTKVEFVPASRQQRFALVQSGEVDILTAGVTRTLTRATQLGLHFGPTLFYDGQGFLVQNALKAAKPADLAGATVCVMPGTTTELNLADYFRQHKIPFKTVVAEEYREIIAAFAAGRCDVLTQDASALFVTRSQLAKPDDYTVLPARISKEPIAPAVRYGDDQWLELITWVALVPVQAEEFGITRDNVDTFLQSEDPSIRRFLGVDPSLAQAIKLDARWAYSIVKQFGNYGEMFERNIGKDSPLKFTRGINDLWTRGGLLYAPPFR